MNLRNLLAFATIAVVPSFASANHNPDDAKEAMMQAHHKMMAEMEQLQPTGDPDRDFVLMMIPHHQGAIDTAKVELEFGHDEGLRTMAEQIIEAQEKEVAELKAWLEGNPH